MLKVFDLTLVIYDSEHPFITFPLGMCALSPFIILVALSTMMIVSRHTRTWTAAVLLSGIVFSELCNYLLKNLIRNPRPSNKWMEELARKQCFSYGDEKYDAGFGMPSAHSQFMLFFAGFLVLPRLDKWKLWSYDTAIVLWSIVVCISRVHHEYHTIEQVTTGCFAGIVLSIIWRRIWMSNRWQLLVKLRTWVCHLFDIQPPEVEEAIILKKES